MPPTQFLMEASIYSLSRRKLPTGMVASPINTVIAGIIVMIDMLHQGIVAVGTDIAIVPFVGASQAGLSTRRGALVFIGRMSDVYRTAESWLRGIATDAMSGLYLPGQAVTAGSLHPMASEQ